MNSEKIRKAAVWKRVLAVFLDSFLLLIPLMLVSSLILSARRTNTENVNSGLVMSFIVIVIYFIFLFKDGWRGGRGIAKGWLGLRIINDDGTPIGVGMGFARSLFSTILSFLIIVDFILIIVNVKGKKIADLILQTQVIDESDFIPADFNTKSNLYGSDKFGICPFCREETLRVNKICEHCDRRK